MKKILENIEAIRKEKGFSQEFVAEKLGIKQPAYSRYFQVQDDMKISLLEQIADILEVSVVDIVTYPEKYVPADQEASPVCEECQKKQETIDNLNELLREYKRKLKSFK